MDIFQIIFGRFIVELIGASIRFLVVNILNTIKGTKTLSFSKFWTPNSNEYKKLETETANKIVGLFFFVLVLVLIFHFG